MGVATILADRDIMALLDTDLAWEEAIAGREGTINIVNMVLATDTNQVIHVLVPAIPDVTLAIIPATKVTMEVISPATEASIPDRHTAIMVVPSAIRMHASGR